MPVDDLLAPPRPLDGTPIDLTHGRGWLDDQVPGGPHRLTRRAKRWTNLLNRRLAEMEAMADENRAFDQVPLTVEEQVDLEEKKSPEQLEEEAGVFGVDEIAGRRSQLAQLAMRMGRGGG